jgi:murein L,D-transpeptidase YcbB/YkuD
VVKLMFPNDYNMYLQNTPAPSEPRAHADLSRGCIRVEKPAELAAWVLRNNDGSTPDRAQ